MNERGFAGGFEVLPFGLLLFVSGTLVLTNGWAVIDAKLAAAAAAREAVRAYVESPTEAGAVDAARRAANDAIDGHGRDPLRASIEFALGPDFRRCAPNTVVVRYRVPTLRVPFVGAFGSGVIETSARHTEIVDPYRTGLLIDDFDAEGCHA